MNDFRSEFYVPIPEATDGRQYEWSSPNPSTDIVRIVAILKNVNPTDLDPIHTAIDPNELDPLLNSARNNPERSSVTLSFNYAGCHITADESGVGVEVLDGSDESAIQASQQYD